ncbi:MAG: helix-turn-helix transcriptional regulator [Stenotrophomonas sp.]|uniref:helix-turn-helix domain-containing protein n=1 Tax=Stenotrophomonas sp. TaxID=69392 RepID=UPI0029B0CCFC|nr:helix-turn-helix transcriptional regulator [Stenotrophomonas sp.]MDX3931297.1 helix-turn-helix transcriptional regulator [Stenotrophomonas sp.]
MFAERLKQARLALGISQHEIARRIGLSGEAVSSRIARYEFGTTEPDFATASEIAKELDVPLVCLLADNDVLCRHHSCIGEHLSCRATEAGLRTEGQE